MGKTKKWLMTAAVMVVLGLILFAAVMTAYQWDFTKLSTVTYETNTYEISEEFHSISVNTDTADLVFAASPDERCSVVCYEAEKAGHSAEVRDGTLTIAVVDKREWYDYIGISIGAPKITVYLPEREYASVCIQESTGDVEIPKDFKFESMDISVSTGDICVKGVTAGMLDLSVSTGKVTVVGVSCEGDVTIDVSTGKAEVTDVRCKNLISAGSTGDIVLENVIASEKISVVRTTGDVLLDGCDGAELFLKSSTGDIEGTLLTEKVFLAESSTGSIDVPDTFTGGKCEISADTGDIHIRIIP